MKADARIDSAVFQLTPTRTRCDLVINANGNSEKIASGLVEPFLSHLKTARDQIAKGGYSIILEPEDGTNTTWFTKGTIERFVRFVSTPEVLERVSTIECEMLQIDEAISIQSSDSLGLNTVEDRQAKSTESAEGSKPTLSADSEKAIVLFKPGAQPPESNGSKAHEENSKVQLLRVLETRKTMLQKEQGMAFARAAAAGFDMDHMAQLLSFSEFFGASRLMDACVKFMELWKRKHETGQWLEIEAADIMSSRSDFSPMNASGIVFPAEMRSREPWSESHGELGVDGNGKASDDAQHLIPDQSNGSRPPMDPQVPSGPHDYYQGHYQPHMYPQWPIHPQSGAPVFSSYTMQGMPYYQNYQASGPYFQPPYPPPMEDPRFNGAHRLRQKRHSMDSKGGHLESETSEMGVSNGRSQDGTDQSLSENEVAQGQDRRRKARRSGKNKSGVVVIRNINYITSKRSNSSGSESKSSSECESHEEADELRSNALEKKHTNFVASTDPSSDRVNVTDGREADTGRWEAFQNLLLRDDDERTNVNDRGTFSAEKEIPIRRRQSNISSDPILNHQELGKEADQWSSEFDIVSSKASRAYKQRASADEFAISREGINLHGGRVMRDGQLDMQLESGRGYRRGANDDFMLYGQGNQPVTKSIIDPLANNEVELAHNVGKSSSQNIIDESFIVPLRSGSHDQVGSDRIAAIDIDSDFSSVQRTVDSSNNTGHQLNYEPNDLSLIPERDTEREFSGYDPAVDYEREIHAEDAVVPSNSKKEDVSTKAKEGMKKSEKDKKSKLQVALEKRKMEAALKNSKLSKSNTAAEAHIRAEKLRAYKADLQKMKRQQEEEQMKRLEELKRERQKRIAARSSSIPAQSPSSSQQRKSRLPSKLSPSSLKGSKFTDSDPASYSPVRRLATKLASPGSNESQKTTKSSRFNSGRLAGNGLSRSVSSLPELKKEDIGPEPKAISRQIRRLSDPKGGSSSHRATQKSGASDSVSRTKSSSETEMKKISALMTLDRTKSATLPELKIKTHGSSSNVNQDKSSSKEIKQKGNGSRSSLTPESIKPKKNSEKTPHPRSRDDYPIIEKTVVMLEHDSSSLPVVQPSEETKQETKGANIGDSLRPSEKIPDYAAIHAPPSPVIINEVNPSEFQFDVHPSLNQVTIIDSKNELPKSLGAHASEKPYQAPFARISSLEDPCTSNLEYSKAPPTTTELEDPLTVAGTTKAHVSHFAEINSLEVVPESLEKPRGKESARGFRRLLKFGRKNHNSSGDEHNTDSDRFSLDGPVTNDHDAASSPDEVHTLKNLISQDDSPVGGTSHKASRPFSLLSPFRSKNSEKKLTT